MMKIIGTRQSETTVGLIKYDAQIICSSGRWSDFIFKTIDMINKKQISKFPPKLVTFENYFSEKFNFNECKKDYY